MDQEDVKRLYKPGRWSKQEHMQFLIALSEFGKDWKQIQAKIPSRSVVQVRSHAQKYFKQTKRSPKLYSNLRTLFKDYFDFLNTVKASPNPTSVFLYCQTQYELHKDQVASAPKTHKESDKFIRII